MFNSFSYLHVHVRNIETDTGAKVGYCEENENRVPKERKVHHLLVGVVGFRAARDASAHLCALAILVIVVLIVRHVVDGRQTPHRTRKTRRVFPKLQRFPLVNLRRLIRKSKIILLTLKPEDWPTLLSTNATYWLY